MMSSDHNRHNERFVRQCDVPKGQFKGYVKGCIAALLFSFSALLFVTTASADEVIMKNGDRLQGSVVSLSSGKLVFKTAYAGQISIQWDLVEKLTTDQPLEAYLEDDKTLVGKVKTIDGENLVLEPADGSPPVPVPIAQIETLGPAKTKAGWEFTGNVTAGASKESGNTDTEKYSLIGNLQMSKLPHVVNLYAEFHKEWSNDTLSKDNALGSATYDRFLTKKWFVFANGTAQTDKFKDLDLLGNLAAGAGYQFWRSPDLNLSARLGPAYAYEKYTRPMAFLDNKDQRDYFAGYWALDFDMWFFNRLFQVFHHDDLLYDFQESTNWVVRTRTGVRIPMVMKLYASFQFNYDYDHQPAQAKKNYDQAWIFGLGWAF